MCPPTPVQLFARRKDVRLRRNLILTEQSDRATDARGMHRAVTAGILRQILLVVILRVEEVAQRTDFGGDRSISGFGKPFTESDGRRMSDFFLLRGRREDRRTVLRAWSLP